MNTRSFAFVFSSVLVACLSAFAGDTINVATGVMPEHPQQPQVAVDAKGKIHIVYGIGDRIFYSQSVADGQSFSDRVGLPPIQTMSLGMRRGPRIAVTSVGICVTAIGGKQGKGRDGDILAIRSVDGGRSWLVPVTINDVDGAAREGLHAMASGPQDSVACVWLDLRNRETEVMSAVSADGGKTWGKNILVYRSPDGSVCECCHPSIAYDSEGKIYVQWRNAVGGARDIYVATSADAGKTFGKASKMGGGSWPLDACPMDGGAIAINSPDKFSTVWRREKSIYLTTTGEKDEHRLGAGEQPWITATTAGPYVVWLKKRGDAALLLTPGKQTPVELAPHANDPVIATGPNGNGPVVAVWEVKDGKKYTIQCQVIKAAN